MENLFLREESIFSPLITGLSDPNPAVRLASVHHAFHSMDRAAATDTEYGAQIVQDLCNVIILQIREESKATRTPQTLGVAIEKEMLKSLGRRLSRSSDENPIRFQGNPLPSRHIFHSPLAKKPELQTFVTLYTAGLKPGSVNISEANFSGANFGESSWLYSTFQDCDLSYCSFHGANLADVTITSSNLSESVFISSVVNFARISADVTNAQFQQSDLQGTRCEFYKATGAVFYSCNMQQANLEGSDSNIDLTQAIVDYDTVFPDGSRLNKNQSTQSGDIVTP